ncbi:hypothetical protein, partial [Mesorhizobium sp. M0019]|uniref:hypothetical protein n=1 Tax=Mesorhizobium sp. M0019 TaxID=2956845 RepID=UPI00333D7565
MKGRQAQSTAIPRSGLWRCEQLFRCRERAIQSCEIIFGFWRYLLVAIDEKNGNIPEGFSMRAAARRLPLALAARVDKPWKE